MMHWTSPYRDPRPQPYLLTWHLTVQGRKAPTAVQLRSPPSRNVHTFSLWSILLASGRFASYGNVFFSFLISVICIFILSYSDAFICSQESIPVGCIPLAFLIPGRSPYRDPPGQRPLHTETPPAHRDSPCTETPPAQRPPDRDPLPVDRQTPVKTLFCPKFRLRAVTSVTLPTRLETG